MDESNLAKTDDSGCLKLRHHDGRLLGVLLEDSDCIIHFESTDGIHRQVRLVGVHNMDLSGFRQGNIILSMTMFPPSEAPTRLSDQQLLRLGHGEFPRFKGRLVFELTPSYGAHLVADCERIEVESTGTSTGTAEKRKTLPGGQE